MTFIPDWKIADDGWPVLALAGIVTILTSMIFLPLGCFFLGIMMWLAHGLRLPNRQTKADDQIIYAPADGVVLDIETDQFPDGLADDDAAPAKRITIQTRLTDTQLQTSPITGHIVENLLLPGLFRKWGFDRSSWQAARLSNERREIRIRDAYDREIMLVQLLRLADCIFLELQRSLMPVRRTFIGEEFTVVFQHRPNRMSPVSSQAGEPSLPFQLQIGLNGGEIFCMVCDVLQ